MNEHTQENNVVDQLFEELKDELTFLPPVDAAKEGFLFGLTYVMFL